MTVKALGFPGASYNTGYCALMMLKSFFWST